MTYPFSRTHFKNKTELVQQAWFLTGMQEYRIDLGQVERDPEPFFLLGAILLEEKEKKQSSSVPIDKFELDCALFVLAPILAAIIDLKEKEIQKWIAHRQEYLPEVADLYKTVLNRLK